MRATTVAHTQAREEGECACEMCRVINEAVQMDTTTPTMRASWNNGTLAMRLRALCSAIARRSDGDRSFKMSSSSNSFLFLNLQSHDANATSQTKTRTLERYPRNNWPAEDEKPEHDPDHTVLLRKERHNLSSEWHGNVAMMLLGPVSINSQLKR